MKRGREGVLKGESWIVKSDIEAMEGVEMTLGYERE